VLTRWKGNSFIVQKSIIDFLNKQEKYIEGIPLSEIAYTFYFLTTSDMNFLLTT